MVLSILLIGFFILFGATFVSATAFFVGIWDYLVALPWLRFNVYASDGVEGSEAFKLAQWQGWWPSILMGLVDCLCTFCWLVPRAYLMLPHDP